MKAFNSLLAICLLLCSINTINTLCQSCLPFKNNPACPEIIYVPVPVSAEYYQTIQQQAAQQPTEKPKVNVFPHIVSIVGDVGKILLDRHNKENVVNGFTHMIGNIVNFVKDVTTKGPLSEERIDQLAHELADQWICL